MTKFTPEERREIYRAVLQEQARMKRKALVWLGIAGAVVFIAGFIAQNTLAGRWTVYAIPAMLMGGILVLTGLLAIIVDAIEGNKP